MDSIFGQFGYDYSRDAQYHDRLDRDQNLSNVSVVAEGWTRPARRLLFREVKIENRAHLQEEVEEGMGQYVRGLEIRGSGWNGMTSLEAASAVFKLLKQVPNLRRLRLVAPPFDSFDTADSASMRAVVLLPHFHDLSLPNTRFPHSIIFDLLATSGHRIDRLFVNNIYDSLIPHAVYRQLDFRGSLRFLSTGASFYRTLVDPRWMNHERLEGLEELQLRGIDVKSRAGGEDLYRVVAPTLRTLTIDSDELTWFAHFLPLFFNLSRLSISGCCYPYTIPDPAPLLRCLPPSISFLRLNSDAHLGPTFSRWTATPSLVPAGLKQIQIDYIENSDTYQQLPPIPTLCTNYRFDTINNFQRLSPGTLPFKTIEMWFHNSYLDQPSVVEAECLRLSVVFRQRIQRWDS